MTNAIIYPELGGFVTSNKDFVGTVKSRKENPEGLFSEQIFGPKKINLCSCGQLSGIIHENETCSKCGVLCGDSNLRTTQFGRIKTEFPFIKPTKQKKLVKYLGKLSNNIINPIRLDVNLDSKRYLAIKNDYSIMKIVNTIKPEKNYLVIPFRVIGIYSLYITIKYAAQYLKVKRAIQCIDENYITDVIKVLPPNLRMYSYDTSKDKKIIPPINKIYTSLLNLKQMNVPLIANIKSDENDWLEQININFSNNILNQEIFPTELTEYESKTATYQKYINKVYDFIYTTLSGKQGLIRNSILGKTLEFSGRTVITVDPSIPPYQIKVSKTMLRKLWMPYFLHYLIEVKQSDATDCYNKYMLNELDNCADFNKEFDEFLVWFYDY